MRKARTALLWDLIERLPFHNFRGVRYSYLKKIFHSPFVSQNLPKSTKSLRSIKDFKKISKAKKFDALVVGSDQVWRWDYILDGYERYFLSFADGNKVKKIAYAASFGKPSWQVEEKESEVASLLADFYAVSTRESDGVKICQKLGRQDCEQVLDPTMLVDKDFYSKFLINSKQNFNQKTLLTYVLDEHAQKFDFMSNVHAHLGSEYVIKPLGLQSSLSVPEWVTAFYNADYVVTDSFHGMIFSILFNKQFIVIGNSHRGISRFVSLLDQLDLKSRMVEESNLFADIAKDLVEFKIDYKEIEAKLQELRDCSSSFLINALA